MAAELVKGPVGVIRLDMEGADQQALAGMAEHLRRDRPALILRLPPVYRESNTERMARQLGIEAQLKEMDYRLLRVHQEKESIRLERISGPIGIHAELDWSNYVALHRDREASVLDAFLVT